MVALDLCQVCGGEPKQSASFDLFAFEETRDRSQHNYQGNSCRYPKHVVSYTKKGCLYLGKLTNVMLYCTDYLQG